VGTLKHTGPGAQVERLRAAGGIVLAKANMGEWALSPLYSVSSAAGVVRNPYDTDRVPAGSSGGVAAGAHPVSLHGCAVPAVSGRMTVLGRAAMLSAAQRAVRLARYAAGKDGVSNPCKSEGCLVCAMQASRQTLEWWASVPTLGTLYAGRPRTAAWWASGHRSACPAGAPPPDWQLCLFTYCELVYAC